MARRPEKERRTRRRRPRSELDWFAEDPWGESEQTNDWEDPDSEEEEAWFHEVEEDWGPIRLRHTPRGET